MGPNPGRTAVRTTHSTVPSCAAPLASLHANSPGDVEAQGGGEHGPLHLPWLDAQAGAATHRVTSGTYPEFSLGTAEHDRHLTCQGRVGQHLAIDHRAHLPAATPVFVIRQKGATGASPKLAFLAMMQGPTACTVQVAHPSIAHGIDTGTLSQLFESGQAVGGNDARQRQRAQALSQRKTRNVKARVVK